MRGGGERGGERGREGGGKRGRGEWGRVEENDVVE